jgi:hypothetical protein
MENFKDIAGYEGLYKISDTGKVLGLKRGKFLKPNHSGRYWMISLCKNNKMKTISVHRLVAITFIPNPNNLPEVNHKNGIKTDNYINNLEWSTRSENRLHSYKVLGEIANKPWLGKFGKDNPRSIPVGQYNLSGQLIATYESSKDAQRKTGIKQGSISMVCNGKKLKQTGGFKWKWLKSA